MSSRETRDALAAFQARFTAVLRQPLDRSSGTLRADPARYDPQLCAEIVSGGGLDPGECLAVYHRQYWFRLFSVIHREYPLTTALLGAWELNRLAAGFLQKHPPRGHDLARVADGLDDFLVGAVAREGRRKESRAARAQSAAIVQAARIDAAFRTVLAAGDQPELRVTAEEGARLTTARLRRSRACALIEEDWPLLQLRRELRPADVEVRIQLPERHPGGRRFFCLVQAGAGTRLVPLAPLQARLLALLATHPLRDALGLLESECPPAAIATLAANATTWLAESVRMGFWSGFDDEATR